MTPAEWIVLVQERVEVVNDVQVPQNFHGLAQNGVLSLLLVMKLRL